MLLLVLTFTSSKSPLATSSKRIFGIDYEVYLSGFVTSDKLRTTN